MKEIWKDYIYNYQISNLGGFKNKVTQKIYKPRLNSNGRYYVCVSLGNRKKYKTILIHRAVAETFIPNPYNKPEVNHKDGNKQNNCETNLEWCDRKYNIEHAKEHKLYKYGEENPNCKITDEDVLYIRNNFNSCDIENNALAMAKKFNISKGHVYAILKNKRRDI